MGHQTQIPTAQPDQLLLDRARARLCMAFLLDLVTTGVGGLSTRDALLVMAVNQANISPLTREPEARYRYGALTAAAPDSERRPVSINAIAHSLGLPFETARRNIKALMARGVCRVSDRGVIVPEAFLTSDLYLQTVVASHQRLRRLYLDLKQAGLLEPLPPSAYEVGDDPPVRAAARLLSDYALRASDRMTQLAGDLVSSLMLIAILSGSAKASIAGLSRHLRVPQETLRRHGVQLEAAGLITRAGRALTITEARLGSAPWPELFHANAMDLHRLLAGLAERGVVEAWERVGQPHTAAARA